MLVLASGSFIRRRLLEAAGLEFVADPADIDERAVQDDDPDTLAQILAVAKARAVAPRHPGRIIIGSDQVFEMDGALGSKPETPEALREQLLSMNGKAHTFHCGLALVRDQELLHAEVDRARVRFHHLSNSEIEDYVATGEGIGCAGGYRLEEGGVRLIESIEGSHFTVLGLPMLGLIAALRTLDPLTLIRRSQENS